MKYINKQSGITLMEILIVVAIIGILISLCITVDFNSLGIRHFHTERSTIISILERARSKALSNYNEKPHGVCFIEPNYIIFEGSICAQDIETNEIVNADPSISSVSNFSSTFPIIIFSQLTATTSGGIIHITDNRTSGNITINNEGAINW